MRRRLMYLAALLAFLGLAAVALFRLTALGEVGSMASGLAAKLACSHRYLSGIDAEQVIADLNSYSSAYSWVEIDYDDVQRRVEARLAGASHLARYREGLGCSLEIGDTAALDEVVVTPVPETDLPWPAGTRVDGIDPEVQATLDAQLALDNEQGYQTRALLLLRDGRIVAESYADGIDERTPLLGWSMGKSLTAMLLGQLELQGLLQVTETRLFPDWAVDERASISVENLLQMSSGLAFEEDYVPGRDATRMLFDTHSAAAIARQQALLYPPGSHFSYSSGTTNLLAELHRQRAGGRLQDAVDKVHDDFLRPLGMAHTVLEPDPSGTFVGSSYVYASARDWARLAQLLLDGGTLNGHRLLDEHWIERAVTPNTSDNEPRYGYQFWLNRGGAQARWPNLPADAFAMLGNRSQVVMIIPSAGAAIVRLGWSAAEYPTSQKMAAILEI